MQIGLVGHPVKLAMAEKILLQNDYSLEIQKLEIAEVPLQSHIEQYKALQKAVDIMMIGGYYDYLFFSNNLVFSKVTGYIARDNASLYRVFLEAMGKGYDIFNLSIDGYKKEAVLDLYTEIDQSPDSARVFDWYDNDILSPETSQNMVDFHRRNYLEHQVALCVTCISVVYERLRALEIPVLLVSPTSENIRLTYEKLRLEYLLKAQNSGDILILDVNVTEGGEGTEPEDDYQFTLEKLRIAEKIFLFSQRLQAAVEEINLGQYLIVTNKTIFERETSLYKSISLLDDAEKLRHCTLSIGIGSGGSLRETLGNAQSARKKAQFTKRTCVYIVHDRINVTGPIYNSRTGTGEAPGQGYQAIAEKTRLSVNTLFKLHAIFNKYKNNVFTVNELSLIYGVSLRSMYRIIDKLEANGYIIDKGKKITDGSGRPSRIIQINLER